MLSQEVAFHLEVVSQREWSLTKSGLSSGVVSRQEVVSHLGMVSQPEWSLTRGGLPSRRWSLTRKWSLTRMWSLDGSSL